MIRETQNGPRPLPKSSVNVWNANAVPRVSGSVTFLSFHKPLVRFVHDQGNQKSNTYNKTAFTAVPVIEARIPAGKQISA